MAGDTQATTSDFGAIDTPIKIAGVGAILVFVEGILDIYYADLYTGTYGGIEVTTAHVLLTTSIALLFTAATLVHIYDVRYTPTLRSYLLIAIFATLSLVIGQLITNIIVLAGAVLGYLELRDHVTG